MSRTGHPRRMMWLALGVALSLTASAWALSPFRPTVSPARAEPDAITTSVAASPEDAIRDLVEADGGRYAGDCAATVSPRDLDKVCSKLIDERGDRRAYLAGRTFSEFTTWVFVQQTTDGWQIAGSAPLDFSATSIEIPWP